MIWDIIIHWTEVNYIRQGHTMVFCKLLCSVWASKLVVVDADKLFSGIFKNIPQKTLMIPIHAFARGNHKEIINEGFHCYLNQVYKINKSDKGIRQQWLQGVLFSQNDCNAGPVYGTDIDRSLVAICRYSPLLIDLYPERSMEGTSEGQQALDHFEATYPHLFIHR